MRTFGWLVSDSVRWRAEGPERLFEELPRCEKNYLFTVWHNRLAGSILYFERFVRRFHKFRVAPMVSESRDGELIARVVRDWGGEGIRGSSSKRAEAALRTAVTEARRGLNVVITGDGPKGPRYRMKPGVVLAAKLSGLPVIPMTWCASRTWQFRKSWDKMLLPMPFSEIVIRFGEPLLVPADADGRGIASARRELERRMAELAVWADERTFVSRVIPAWRETEKRKPRKAQVVAADKRL